MKKAPKGAFLLRGVVRLEPRQGIKFRMNATNPETGIVIKDDEYFCQGLDAPERLSLVSDDIDFSGKYFHLKKQKGRNRPLVVKNAEPNYHLSFFASESKRSIAGLGLEDDWTVRAMVTKLITLAL